MTKSILIFLKPTKTKFVTFIIVLLAISFLIMLYVVKINSFLPFRMFEQRMVSCNFGNEKDAYVDCVKTFVIYPGLASNIFIYYLLVCLLAKILRRKSR